MSSPVLEAVLEATRRLPPAVVEELTRGVLRASSAGAAHVLADAVPHQDFRRAADALAVAWQLEPDVSGRELAAMLGAAAAARAAAGREGRVEVVMTGPSEADAPTRSTEAVVIELVAGARRDLILVTYAAAPYPPLLAELELARARGVRTQVVVETVAGARGLLASEPFHAFASASDVELFHWPLSRRPGLKPGRLHAKLAVADGEVAFVTSANLTGSAIESNLECGLLVHGGSAPRRLADHLAALMRHGVLQPLTPNIEGRTWAP